MLLFLVACSNSNGGSIVSDDTAALAAKVATVIEVSFSLSEPAEVCIAYNLAGGEEQVTPNRSLEAGDHMMRILGVPPVTEVTWSVVTTADGETESRKGGEIRTGDIPSSVPTFTVYSHDADQTDEQWLIGSSITTGDTDVQFVIDRQGQVVWYHQTDAGVTTPWIETPVDGNGGVLYNELDVDFCTFVSAVHRIDMSGEAISETQTELGHHAFLQHEDGTIAFVALDSRNHEDYEDPVCGDAVVEVAPDGTTTTLVSTWDLFELVHNDGMDTRFYCQCIDWTHANMLSWNPDTGSYLLSLANIDTMVEFDRESGAVLRQFGEEPGSYAFDPAAASFSRQHGGHYTVDGALLLTQTTRGVKRTTAIEYLIDDDRETIEKVWSYGEDLALYAQALGEPHRLPNQNTLVNFGTEGVIHEVTDQGDLVWEVGLDPGVFLGRTQLLEDIYMLDTE